MQIGDVQCWRIEDVDFESEPGNVITMQQRRQYGYRRLQPVLLLGMYIGACVGIQGFNSGFSKDLGLSCGLRWGW
jgi:hypothetical protein